MWARVGRTGVQGEGSGNDSSEGVPGLGYRSYWEVNISLHPSLFSQPLPLLPPWGLTIQKEARLEDESSVHYFSQGGLAEEWSIFSPVLGFLETLPLSTFLLFSYQNNFVFNEFLFLPFVISKLWTHPCFFKVILECIIIKPSDRHEILLFRRVSLIFLMQSSL